MTKYQMTCAHITKRYHYVPESLKYISIKILSQTTEAIQFILNNIKLIISHKTQNY